MEVRIASARAPERCALCHGELGDPSRMCAACGTVLHDECRVELARCPTLGCLGAVVRVAALVRPLRAWVLALAVILPALPVAILGVACKLGHLERWGDVFGTLLLLGGLKVVFALVGLVLSLAWNYQLWDRHGGARGALPLLATPIVIAAAFWFSGDVGAWLWDEVRLRPHAAALRSLAASGAENGLPAELGELHVVRMRDSPKGVCLYFVVGGGPFPSWGLLIPRDGEKPRDAGGQPCCVRPSAVDGVYWFGEH